MTLNSERFRLDVRNKFFIVMDKTQKQVAQGSCGCPIPESVQEKAVWVSEQPGLWF